MKRSPFSSSLFTLLCCCLFLSACFGSTNTPEPDPVPATEETEEIAETKNVFYSGTVQPAGISIYQEGTHKLVLPDGRFILLESNAIDLNGYVGEEVELFGSLRPTVEAGGMIMNVEKAVAMIDEDEDEEEDTNEATGTGSTTEQDDTTVPPQEDFDDSSDKEDEIYSETEETDTPELSEEDDSESDFTGSTSSVDPVVRSARAQKMSGFDYSEEYWSLEYCSSHIGFCIPVHKWFWYRSFGATDQDLWHVELGSDEVQQIGDGPIVLQLLPGELPSGASDRKTMLVGEEVKGYVLWNKGYFVVSAPASLENAVSYIVSSLYEAEE